MKKTGLILDSTVYLNQKTLSSNNIKVVSLNILEGDNVYKETEINQQFVFDELDAGKKLTTSQPSPDLFKDAYNDMIEQGYQKILVITISRGISGTYQSAKLGKELCSNSDKIHLFDTLNAGFGNELIAMETLRFINEEDNPSKVIERTNAVIKRVRLFFTVQNLFSLQKGGRLSKTQAFLGTVLRVKPIIRLDKDGTLNLVHKERTEKKLMAYIVKQMQEDVSKDKEIIVRIVHQRSENSANALKKLLEETFDNIKISVTDYIGPVFSIHIGKKGFGISWYTL